MFAKLLAVGTPRFIGLASPGIITLSATHPQQEATWEIIDPAGVGTTSLITGMQVTIKTANNPRELLEWFTSGGGGVRTTTSIIPTPTTKFLIQMPGSPPGTIIPHGANITLSSRPAAATGTSLRGFIAAVVSGLLSVFTGSPPAWYLSATATSLTLARLATPGTAETFQIFQAPLISAFTIRPVSIPFGRTTSTTADLFFLFSTPTGGAAVNCRVRSGARFIRSFPTQITVPGGVQSHSEPLPLKWDVRTCETLSIDASTVLPFVATRSEVFIANLIEPCPYFSMKVTPEFIDVTAPPTPAAVSIEFVYDTSRWPSRPQFAADADTLGISLSTSHPGVVFGSPSSWSVSGAAAAPTLVSLTVTPTSKEDCISITVSFKFFSGNPPMEIKTDPNKDGIVVRTKSTA